MFEKKDQFSLFGEENKEKDENEKEISDLEDKKSFSEKLNDDIREILRDKFGKMSKEEFERYVPGRDISKVVGLRLMVFRHDECKLINDYNQLYLRICEIFKEFAGEFAKEKDMRLSKFFNEKVESMIKDLQDRIRMDKKKEKKTGFEKSLPTGDRDDEEDE